MKSRVVPLLFAVVILTFSNCGGDDDPKSSSKVVGKWNVKTIDPIISVVGGNIHEFLVNSAGMTEEDATAFEASLNSPDFAGLEIQTMEFRSDLTYTTSDGVDHQDGNWEISADEKTLTVDKGTAHEDQVPIRTLTDTALVFEVDESDLVDIDGLKYTLLITLERVQ